MGTFETYAFYAFDSVYVFGDYCIPDFFRRQGGQHHTCGSSSDTGYSYQQAEEFPFILGSESVIQLFVFPKVVMDIDGGGRFSFKLRKCLKGYEYFVTYPIVLERHFCRSELCNFPFDVIYHKFSD